MQVLDQGLSALLKALLENGFREVDAFDTSMTFERDGDPLKLHVGLDGSFSAFDITGECMTEGEGAEALYRMLVAKPLPARRPPPR